MNNGTGTFAATATQTFFDGEDFNSDSKRFVPVVADVNGDGHLDLLTMGYSNSNADSDLDVVLGNGSGTFASNPIFTIQSDAYSLATGDLNGDGLPYLITTGDDTTSGHHNSSALIGDGNGGFAASSGQISRGFDTGTGPESVAAFSQGTQQYVAISNGDRSNLDGTFGAIKIMQANSSGGLTPIGSEYYTGGGSGGQIARGDFNGDGYPDIVEVNPGGGSSGSVTLLLNTTHGGFTPKTYSGVENLQDTESLAVGDFNGDGKLDFAVTDATPGAYSISIFIGNGDGTFKTPSAPSGTVVSGFSAAPYSIVAGHFNEDKGDQIAIGYGSARAIGILEFNSDGSHKISTPSTAAYAGSPFTTTMTVGDLNLDGHNDLVIANGDFVYVMTGNGDGTFQSPKEIGVTDDGPTQVGTFHEITAIAVADFNGDGKPDVVVTGEYSPEITVMLNSNPTPAWTGKAKDHNWGSATNWSTGTVPLATQNTYIEPNAGTINVAGTYSVLSLVTHSPVSIASTGLFTASGNLFADSGINNNGTLQIYGGTSATPAVIRNYQGPDLTGTGTLTLGQTGTAANLKFGINNAHIGVVSGFASSLALLTINTGSTLDITNNKLIINFSADPFSTLQSYLKSAYTSGTWTGTGITSTVVAMQAASVKGTTNGTWSIGYSDGARDGTTGGVTSNQFLIAPELVADANLDGKVDFNDLLLLAQNNGSTTGDWAHADFNYDGKVDFNDLLLLAQNNNKTNGNTLLAGEIPAGDQLPTGGGYILYLLDDGTDANGNEIYVLMALDLGGETGTKLAAIDLTITTLGNGTNPAPAMVVDHTDIDGDGITDADVTGQWDYAGNRPNFGGGYTFIGIAASHSSTTAGAAQSINVPTGQFISYGSAIASVYGDLTSLEVQELASSPVTDTIAIPIANIVVPAGTTININATLTGTNGASTQITGMDNSVPGTDFGGTTTAGS